MNQKGLIIGFANQQRKRVLQSYNNQSVKLDNYFMISKAQGFMGVCKKEIQQEIIQLISMNPIVNTIYIVLKYQRIDNMRRQLSQIMEHFQKYVNNIYLIVANFQISKDKQKDQETIKTKLLQENNLTNYFQYQFGKTYDQDSIYVDQQEIKGEDIIHYFNKTICQQIILDGNLMNLYPQINYQILLEIEQFLHQNKAPSDQEILPIDHQDESSYINQSKIENQNVFQSRDKSSGQQNKIKIDILQEKLISNTQIETTDSKTILNNQLEFGNSNQYKESCSNDSLEKNNNRIQTSQKFNDNKVSQFQQSYQQRKVVYQIQGASQPYLGVNFNNKNKDYSCQRNFLLQSPIKCQEKQVWKIRTSSQPINYNQPQFKDWKKKDIICSKIYQNIQQIRKGGPVKQLLMINSKHNAFTSFRAKKQVFI